MAKVWQPLNIDVYKGWLTTIMEEASDELNEWESNFIASIEERLKKGVNLTEAQADKLESIYATYTS